MTDKQWETLVAVIRGEKLTPVPTGSIIDSPWLPKWAGHTILDYFTDERTYLEDNMKALETFPDTMFLPGFWSEYGMCTEPSAFGSVCMWEQDEFPFARKVIHSVAEVERVEKPNVRKDGLLPFVIKRLQHLQPEIEKSGHKIRFAVARGPLNIASFLMGTTEFLTALRTDPEVMHRLLDVCTEYLEDWIAYQKECFPTIDGILLLDDIVGFVSRRDFETFGLPYLHRAFGGNYTVKFFHNDAPCKMCAPGLPEAGINFLNFGIQHTLLEMKEWTGNRITLLGNVPPRDVLALGTPDDVQRSVTEMLEPLDGDYTRLVASVGGGMPPGAPTANIRAFINTVNELTA